MKTFWLGWSRQSSPRRETGRLHPKALGKQVKISRAAFRFVFGSYAFISICIGNRR